MKRGIAASRSQAVILKRGENIKYLPSVFTEYGAIMAANVLNTQHAVRMSVYVVRAFIRLFSNPENGWNGAPVLSAAKQSRRKAIERLERMERH